MTLVAARMSKALPTAVPAQYAYRLRDSNIRAFEPRPRNEPIQMRKLKYHVNTSVDGFIMNQSDGFAAFPVPGDASEQYLQSLHAYGIALMGRCTYETGLEAGIDDPYPHLMSYVFSRTMRIKHGSQVEVVSEDAAAWVRRLKTCPGKDLYLCGGAELAVSLFRANLIDEMILKVSPVLQGSGKRLLSEINKDIVLTRESSAAYDDGVVMLSYRVEKCEVALDVLPDDAKGSFAVG